MRAIDALGEMLRQSGISKYAASLKLGKSRNYITAAMQQKNRLGADKLANVARVCGYRLVLVPENGGDEIEIGGIEITDGYEKIG